MKQNFKYLLLFFLLASCSKIYDLNIPEAEPSLVAEAYISAQNGVHVYLTSSESIGTNFKESNEYGISSASISLYNANEVRIDSLIEIETGIYQSISQLELDLNDSYKLQISHNDYPLATTEWVTIPEPFTRLDTFIQIINDTINVEFTLEGIVESMGDLSFGFDIRIDATDFEFIPTGNPSLENCEATRFPFKNLSIYQQDCFNGKTSKINERLHSKNQNQKIYYFIGLISPEARIYYRSINNQPIGFEQVVSSPIITKGNIINGEGVFYGIYEYEFEIQL